MERDSEEEGKPVVAVLGLVRAATVWAWRVAKRIILVSTLLLLSPVLMPCLLLLVVLLVAGAVPVGIVVLLAKFWPRPSPFRRGLAFHRETRPLAYSPLPAAASGPSSESGYLSAESDLEVEGTGKASGVKIGAESVAGGGGERERGGGEGKETWFTPAHQLDDQSSSPGDAKADHQLHRRRRQPEHLHGLKLEDAWDSAQGRDRLLSGPRDSLELDDKHITTVKGHGQFVRLQTFWREKEMQARAAALAPLSPGAASLQRTPSAVQVEGVSTSLGKRIRGEIVGLKKFLGDGSATEGPLLEEIEGLGKFLGIDLPVNAAAPRSDLERAKECIEIYRDLESTYRAGAECVLADASELALFRGRAMALQWLPPAPHAQRNGLRQLSPLLCSSPPAGPWTRQLGIDSHRSLALALNRPASKVLAATPSSQQGAVESAKEALAGAVTAVDKDTFWPIVHGAEDKLVVLDMYTQWCGPCRLIAPKIEELAKEYTDVLFLKMDCNQDNKALAKELGIRVVPTFKLLRRGEIVKEVAGAKYKELVSLIDAERIKP